MAFRGAVRGTPYCALSVEHVRTKLLHKVSAAGFGSDASVHDIEERIVRGQGKDISCPVDGLPGASYANSVGEDPDDIGVADFMLSYTWQYSMKDISDTLVAFCKSARANPTRIYVWMCFSCVNQHRVKEEALKNKTIPFDAFRETFRERVDNIGHIIAMMSPWHSPGYLKRVWCNFELHTALEHQKEITIMMPPLERDDFLSCLREPTGYKKFWAAFANIDIENANASVAVDKDNILNIIRERTGYKDFNSKVGRYLQQWAIDQYVESLETCRCNMAKYGVRQVLDLHNDLADLFKQIGKPRQALKHIEDALQLLDSKASDVDGAAQLRDVFVDNLSRLQRSLGSADPVKRASSDLSEQADAGAWNHKACDMLEEKDFQGAIVALSKAEMLAKAAEPRDDTLLAQVMLNQGVCLTKLGNIHGAKEAMEASAALVRETGLVDTPTGAEVFRNLCAVNLELDDLPGAEEAILTAIAVCQRTCTTDAAIGGNVHRNHAAVLWEKRDALGAFEAATKAAKCFTSGGLDQLASEASDLAAKAKARCRPKKKASD